MRNLRLLTLLYLGVIPGLVQAATFTRYSIFNLQEFLDNSTNTDIHTLCLLDSHIGDAGAVLLAEALKANTSLTSAYIANNGIGDAGAVALAMALKANTSLTILYLDGNQIGDAGAIALAEALKVNKTLTTLYIYGNQIGDAGAAALETIRKRLIRNTLFPKVKYYEILLPAAHFPIQLGNDIWTEEIFDALRIQIESEIP